MFSKIFSIFTFLILIVPSASAQETVANADHFGIFTILPPLVAIALAFIMKNVIISLFFGTLVGCVMIASRSDLNMLQSLGYGFLHVNNTVIASLADVWNAGIILQVMMIGSMIALITRLGAIRAIAEWISKYAKSSKSSQIVTWLMGFLIFFDDYASSLTVGPMMRPITDKMKISREKLSFIVDATAAPIAGMALISTWVAYEVGVINNAVASLGLKFGAYNLFVASLPYRYYNILALIFIPVGILLVREFGPMYKAEYRARTTGEVLRPGSVEAVTDKLEPFKTDSKPTGSIWYGIIPIGTLIIGAFVGFYFSGKYNALIDGSPDEIALVQTFSFQAVQVVFGYSDASKVLFQAAFAASVVAIIIGVVKKEFKLNEALDTALSGIKSMNITGVILLLAWSLSSIVKELETGMYLVHNLSDTIPIWGLPAVIFILGSIISFATGTSYGTMGILMPLAIPLAWAISPTQDYLTLCIGAVLTGAIFGDHCSPISDTSILSAMGSSCDLMDHVRTQMLYAIVVAVITIICYILAGLGMNAFVTILIGIVAIIGVFFIFGKKLPA